MDIPVTPDVAKCLLSAIQTDTGSFRFSNVTPDTLRPVHAPIGLDVEAETPEEIAVAIAAELVMVRRGGTGQPLRDRERVADRWVTGRDGGSDTRDGRAGSSPPAGTE
jgi:hypothetical protein